MVNENDEQQKFIGPWLEKEKHPLSRTNGKLVSLISKYRNKLKK